MNTNKYSLESRRKQANLYKTWGLILVVIGFGLFLYAGAKIKGISKSKMKTIGNIVIMLFFIFYTVT